MIFPQWYQLFLEIKIMSIKKNYTIKQPSHLEVPQDVFLLHLKIAVTVFDYFQKNNLTSSDSHYYLNYVQEHSGQTFQPSDENTEESYDVCDRVCQLVNPLIFLQKSE